MSEVTIEQLEKKLEKQTEEFKAMLEKFKATVSTAFIFPGAEIQLRHNEHYAGIIIGKDGEPSYHLILVDGEKEKIKWKDAVEWAKTLGAELPNRREQALLYANLKEQFKPEWHWSSEEHASVSACAWIQGFTSGNQTCSIKDNTYRARAVRRLFIE